MTQLHVCAQGDALDLICKRHYGLQAGAVEQVLQANPQIAAVAHRLPEGTRLILPDLSGHQLTGQTVRLWD